MKNKKIILATVIWFGILATAASGYAYGGGQGNGQGNGGGCRGDKVCMEQKQSQGMWNQHKSGQEKNKGQEQEFSDIENSQKYELSKKEEEYISHMREEEKIARDVYIKLYEKNIKDSEQKHMDAVKVLIDKYGLEDSMKSNEIGEFTDPEFQKLYNDLIEKGMKSEIDALQAGMTIEDVDIYDLERYMAESENPDVIKVFENLNNGSFNYMRAFKRQLDKVDGQYSSQFISSERMSEVLSGTNSAHHKNEVEKLGQVKVESEFENSKDDG